MYLNEANKIPYLFEVWQKQVAKRPEEVYLVDIAHNIKFTLKQSDEISGKVYAYLKNKKIRKEDFVLINLPRGGFDNSCYAWCFKSWCSFCYNRRHFGS